MGTIRDKMTADLELRGFASTTKKEYLRRAHNFIAYHRRPPTELGEQDIREFLPLLARRIQLIKLPELLPAAWKARRSAAAGQ